MTRARAALEVLCYAMGSIFVGSFFFAADGGRTSMAERLFVQIKMKSYGYYKNCSLNLAIIEL